MNKCSNCGRYLPVVDVHGKPIDHSQCEHCGMVSPYATPVAALVSTVLLLAAAAAVVFWLKS